MGNNKTFVVGVNGSAPSKAALRWAVRHLGADDLLVAVHAGNADQTIDRAWLDPAGNADCGVNTCVVDEDPSEALLSAADRFQADAIVVGPHSGLRNRQALGSITRRVLQNSTIPVIVAAPDPTDSPGPVVACVGYGDATENAAVWASRHAASYGHDLQLLHVVGYRPIFPADSPSEMLASYMGPDVLREWAEQDVKEIRDQIELVEPDLSIHTKIEVGFASSAIVAASADAELVVVGKRQDNAALRHFISPRIHRLIAKASSTVAVVPSCSNQP